MTGPAYQIANTTSTTAQDRLPTHGLRKRIVICQRAQRVLTALLLLLGLAFYVVAYRPATATLSVLDGGIQSKRRVLEESLARASALPQVTADVEQLRARLGQSKRLPAQTEWSEFVRDIDRLSQVSALRPFSYKWESPEWDALFLRKPIRIDFEGDYLNVFSFLRHAESQDRLTRLKSLSVRRIDDRPGQVRVQMSLNTYFAVAE